MELIATRDGAVLRPAVAADIEPAAALAVRCWAPIFASFRDLLGEAVYRSQYPSEQDWQANKAQQIRAHFERHPEWFFVVERAGAVVAFVTFHVDEQSGVGTIGNNGVSPDCAGQGWGTFMYRHVLAHFRDLGLKLATVQTGLDVGHAPARRAYEAVGFDKQIPMVRYWQDLTALNPGSEPE